MYTCKGCGILYKEEPLMSKCPSCGDQVMSNNSGDSNKLIKNNVAVIQLLILLAILSVFIIVISPNIRSSLASSVEGVVNRIKETDTNSNYSYVSRGNSPSIMPTSTPKDVPTPTVYKESGVEGVSAVINTQGYSFTPIPTSEIYPTMIPFKITPFPTLVPWGLTPYAYYTPTSPYPTLTPTPIVFEDVYSFEGEKFSCPKENVWYANSLLNSYKNYYEMYESCIEIANSNYSLDIQTCDSKLDGCISQCPKVDGSQFYECTKYCYKVQETCNLSCESIKANSVNNCEQELKNNAAKILQNLYSIGCK